VPDGFELTNFGIGGLDFVELRFDAVFGRVKALVNIIFFTNLFDRPFARNIRPAELLAL
jgi:hypothetical protein